VSQRVLATIDSGSKAGAAVWDTGELVFCRLVKEVQIQEWQSWIANYCLQNDREVYRTVVELPIYHTEGKSKVPPSSLIQLGFSAGRLVPAQSLEVETIWPVTWKGSLPDEILYARIMSALTESEKALIPKLGQSLLHNVLDAIGIGLHTLGRMPRQLVT
jgi:hypothetical protein